MDLDARSRSTNAFQETSFNISTRVGNCFPRLDNNRRCRFLDVVRVSPELDAETNLREVRGTSLPVVAIFSTSRGAR